MPKRKWTIQISAELTVEFEPWQGIELDTYLEQIGCDSVGVPDYIEDGSVRVDWVSVNPVETTALTVDI